MVGFIKTELDRGQLNLSASAFTDTTTVDVYNKIAGTFTDGDNLNFNVASNKITFTGSNGTIFLFTGVSDMQVNKTCTMTYGLFKNGSVISGAETPHTFTAASKISNISITQIIALDYGDELDVYVKSDALNTRVTVASLAITFLGVK